MVETLLISGNEAIARGVIQAGCRYFFGYSITPQSDIPGFMAWELPRTGGAFVQCDSETASAYMAYGFVGFLSAFQANCTRLCPQDCVVIPGDRFTPQGYLLPVFADTDRCAACGICGWICPTSPLMSTGTSRPRRHRADQMGKPG